ncbi:hypothetical protein BDV32DRAFT_129281 [Aspergillus pseudonomiae]|nr:hypothetical protein BDV32DRAFT_129281 [Aspergillus pseudonomiae]
MSTFQHIRVRMKHERGTTENSSCMVWYRQPLLPRSSSETSFLVLLIMSFWRQLLVSSYYYSPFRGGWKGEG